MATCTVSGTLLNPSGMAIASATVRFNIETPVLDGDSNLIGPREVSTTTASDGTWELDLVQGSSGVLSIDCPQSATANTSRYTFAVVVPEEATADFAAVWADSVNFTNNTTFPISFDMIVGTLDASQMPEQDPGYILVGSLTSTTASVPVSGDATLAASGALTVASVGGSTASAVNAATVLANAATSSNTPSAIVKRDASGNFTATTITANLTGNASGSAASFTGSLAGDVSGTQGATVVDAVGGSTSANVHAAELIANAATSANTSSTIVKRDSSGNFVAGTITADLDKASGTLSVGGNATTINIGNAGATVNVAGTTVYENVSQLQVTDPLITLNKGGGAGSASLSGLELEEASSVTGYAKTSADRNSWTLKAPNTAGVATVTPGAGGITLDQSSHNPVTIGTANGLSLATQALSLQAADTSHTGALTSTDWNTFNGKQAAGNYITALTEDVTASGPGSAAATIANDAVTNAKAANMATQTIKGRTTAGTGDPEDLTATQATAILNVMVGDSGSGGTKGLVPAPSSGDAAASKFLKADGTWVAPAGTGTRPTFSVHRNSVNQTFSAATQAKVQWTTETLDSNSNFDNATNYRFTPTVAGWYHLHARIRFVSLVSEKYIQVDITKNGSTAAVGLACMADPNPSASVDTLEFANGTTDYFEVLAYQNDTVSRSLSGARYDTEFHGTLVLAT